jgi:hypothetical protein
MANYYFYCDESYDSQSTPPRTFVVGGFFAQERIWERIERRWNAANNRAGVSRYHASHLNAYDHEFEGWSRPQNLKYSKSILRILTDQKKKLHAVSCALFGEDYERIIDECNRRKLGNHYVLCFKTCVAMIAKEMRQFPPEDRFSVILDRGVWQEEAVKAFHDMQGAANWEFHSRLGACRFGGPETVGLQPADLIAYESFRYLHGRQIDAPTVRALIRSMFEKNGFLGFFFDADAFERLKQPVQEANVPDNGFIVTFPTPSDPDFEQIRKEHPIHKWDDPRLD